MPTTRRQAIQALMTAAAAVAVPARVRATRNKQASADAVAVLYDPTRCIGCLRCIRGCAEANGCDVESATGPLAQLTTTSLTVLRKYRVNGTKTYRKLQCMHCVDPACVSACMLGAMSKGADGAVTWNGDLCVGCRYCEIACPFNIPRFEWDTPTPELKKCELCKERRAEGQLPACVERCRRGALTYGRRVDLLAEAQRRIAAAPQLYNPKIYGEHDGGGTSVLYLAKAGISFPDMGLPELGEESVPALPEKLQHTIYKGMIAPLALLGVFSVATRRNTRTARLADTSAEHDHNRSEAVGGRIFTWPFAVLALLFIAGLVSIAWRFTAGLGSTTNLNDGYPMGIWIAFDVVTGTALACGGYAMALLVYLLNRGKYHPLVRAAIVTSVLGYTLGGLSVLIDIGRAWNFYKIPLYVTHWNANSILLEVALCIMLYTFVLWLELSPVLLERWRESEVAGVRKAALAVSPVIERAMPYLIAVGLLLPTMHQSSLGSLMLIAGAKLHVLWRTPLLPLLFLISAVGMGYAAVTLESCISSRVFKRPAETPMLRALGLPVALVLLLYGVLRVVDIAWRGQIGAVMALDSAALLFLLEMGLLVMPALALLAWRRWASAGFLSILGVLVIFGGALYRFSTYLIAYDPGPEWSYFPALPEIAVTVGLVAAEVMGYLILIKKFPILRAASARPASHGLSPTATAAAIVLLLLSAFATPASAQRPTTSEDLRCLTEEARTCLPKPIARTEPHGGRCATCHDLSEQVKLTDASRTCASAGCHTRADTLTPFHRGLRASVRDNCIGCHDAHDARIHSGSKNCQLCHAAGGQFTSQQPARAPSARRTRIADREFVHDDHKGVACTQCHGTGLQHADFNATRLQECRSCHHRQPLVAECRNCHDTKQIRALSSTVQWTFAMEVGSLLKPRREIPFAHASHIEESCQSCHTTGARPGAANANCSSCHEQHHRPTANCTQCHDTPSAGAHTRTAHLGCGGTGCHDAAPASVRAAPRTRSLCLSCHDVLVDHQPGENCIACHKLPPPRSSGSGSAGGVVGRGAVVRQDSVASGFRLYRPLATAHSRPRTSRSTQLLRK